MGPDDVVLVAWNYAASVVVCLALVAAAMLARITRKPVIRRFSFIPMIATICIIANIVITFRMTKCLTLLNSEDQTVAADSFSEFVNSKIVSCEQAVLFIKDVNQPPTVRFYLSCMIADKLNHSDSNAVEVILQSLKDAPQITPIFYGTNTINFPFYNAEGGFGGFSAQKIVEIRLLALRKE